MFSWRNFREKLLLLEDSFFLPTDFTRQKLRNAIDHDVEERKLFASRCACLRIFDYGPVVIIRFKDIINFYVQREFSYY